MEHSTLERLQLSQACAEVEIGRSSGILDCRIAQQQGASPSLSTLDRRIGTIFFVWDIFNVFLGAMLGGSIFSQLGTLIKNPGSIASSIGTALPAASNFFINFIILQVRPFTGMASHLGHVEMLLASTMPTVFSGYAEFYGRARSITSSVCGAGVVNYVNEPRQQ